MVSVGIVSVMIGGRAIWTVPGTFVMMMAIGAAVGWSGLDIPSIVVESAIALSVILLGGVIVLDAKLPLPVDRRPAPHARHEKGRRACRARLSAFGNATDSTSNPDESRLFH